MYVEETYRLNSLSQHVCDILGAKLGRVCLKNAHELYQMMLKQSPEYARRPRCRNAAIDM